MGTSGGCDEGWSLSEGPGSSMTKSELACEGLLSAEMGGLSPSVITESGFLGMRVRLRGLARSHLLYASTAVELVSDSSFQNLSMIWEGISFPSNQRLYARGHPNHLTSY